MGQLLQQYSQTVARLKEGLSAVVLDTITTRFLILFLFVLLIPMAAVIIFTASLLNSYLNDATDNQLILSRNLFETALSNRFRQLAELDELSSLSQNTPPPYGLCPPIHDLACLVARYEQGVIQTGDGRSIRISVFKSIAPGLAAAFRTTLEDAWFLARWNGRLHIFSKRSIGSRNQMEVFHGYPVDDHFLGLLFENHPNLETSIFILKTPTQAGPDLILANSPSAVEYPSAYSDLWGKLPSKASSLPFSLTMAGKSYRLLQQDIYDASHEKIARIIHILPLAKNEMLIRNYYIGMYIISVASLLLSIGLAMAAGRTITQPLLKLLTQVNTLSRETVMRDKDEVFVRGVHEIRQLGEAFNRMLKRLRQEHKMKDEFVATLTHDLKVPLLAEKQTLTYFKKEVYGSLSDEQAEVLDILSSSNRSCLGLVNGLLEVYRYDSGEVTLVFELFNLLNLLNEIVGELKPLAQEKAITLTMESPLSNNTGYGDNATVFADRLEIKRVLHNLVSNAITNTPTHGTVRCSVTDEAFHGASTVYKVSGLQYTTLRHPVNLSDRLLVTVADSGIGFTPEDLPNLFRQFAASKGRNPMSIGLGLYNCHQVIQAHNGVLWVETTEGEGSMVGFVLPKNKQAAQDRRVYSDRRKPSA